MCADDACKRAFVGQRECLVSQFGRTHHHLLRMGGAAQEAEIGQAMKFCVVGERHAVNCTKYSYWSTRMRAVDLLRVPVEKTVG